MSLFGTQAAHGDGETGNQPAGTLTDDTEQALCIARSLVDHHTFDLADVADRAVAWYDSGPVDIGRMTMRSPNRPNHGDTWDEAGRHVWEKSPREATGTRDSKSQLRLNVASESVLPEDVS